jgi:hypothetical protein
METKHLILLLVDNLVKGIVTKLPTCARWWHTEEHIDVPLEDWNNDKIHIGNINKYR